jgi:hypothetical protein
LDYPYFCAGVYGARKNCLPRDRFLELAKMARTDKRLFKCDDQSVLNYLLFSEFERGKLSYHTADIQFFPSHFASSEMAARFIPSSFRSPPKTTEENLIPHFSGKKPIPWFGGSIHKSTFTCFRLMHGRFVGRAFWRAAMDVFVEDLNLIISKIWTRGRRILPKST